MRRQVFLIFLALALIVAYRATTYVSSSNQPGLGIDLSWPNCNSKLPMEPWGIIGVNNGLDFSGNPCVFNESSDLEHYALYMNTGYPGSKYAKKYSKYPLNCRITSGDCLAYNYGYNAGKFALTYSALQGVHSNFWWLDVETINSWSNSVYQNRAALEGMTQAIRQNTLLTQIGFYSDSYQWKQITGSWQNQLPVWLATGTNSSVSAATACNTRGFTGTKVTLAQFLQVYDKNYLCKAGFVTNLENR